MKRGVNYILFSTLLFSGSILSTLSCSKPRSNSHSVIESVSLTTLEKKLSVAPDKTASRSIQVRAVVDKKAILEQDYFYSLSLQYSSIYDKKYDLYTQSSASALVPVHFRIVGRELDLIADNRNQFPSDVNHPEQLISRFVILEETDKTLTISQANSANYLAANLINEGATGAAIPQDHWARSFEFASEGQYILQQSSVQLVSGEMGEFLESIFPKENMKLSNNFKIFQLSSDHTTGVPDPALTRYRFIESDHIFNGESKLSYAVHFDLPTNQSTIDWWVTPNIPDENLEPVRLAVEGWNRYFKNFKGISRDVLTFKGRLPEGIHLGDPRYNVINWDSRLVAGAAYESQSYDPNTGKQANSIIYMPAAWIKIGMDYWANGEFSDPGEAQARAQSPSRHRSVCYRDMREAAAYLASGKLKVGSEEALKKFGIELLKQTLFHELGHGLGLDHNFKASLIYQPETQTKTNVKPIFSTSIMDYNDFEIERQAFDDLHSSSGPQLEYDRQALSAIYNSSLDVGSADPILPTCNDKEADNEAGGVDPLCSRYDVEHDPSHSILNAEQRISQASIANDVTLSEAILQVPPTILSAEVLVQVKTKADLDLLTQKLSTAFDGVLSYYLGTGRASLGYATKTNLKTLYKFADNILPSEYDPRLMRERVYSGVVQVLKLKSLPDVVNLALASASQTALESLKSTPYFASLSAGEVTQIISDKQKLMLAHVSNFARDEKIGLASIRTKMLVAMARHPGVAFFFGPFDQTQVDYEMMMIVLLSEATLDKDRTSSERLAAAKSLSTFSGRKIGDDAISKAEAGLSAQRDEAKDSDARDLAESLLKTLSGSSPTNSLK